MGKLNKVGKKIEKIKLGEEKYPEKLIKIRNPPKQIYCEGNIDLLKENIIAIVGSRNYTKNGKKLAEKFTKELVEQGLVIASGLAHGIDTIAHKTTLENRGKTIAILGNGFNNIFPKENTELYNRIIAEGGLIISEYPPEVKAESIYFIKRNRIVSGISIGVLVIEAAYRSGTSITARLAEEQGKKVFVLPHEIGDIHGVGTNNLIKKGAILVTSTKEIIDQFSFLKYKEIPKDSNIISKGQEKNVSRVKDINLGKDDKENNKYKKVYEIIERNVLDVNEICTKTKISLNEINKYLLLLEVNGFIKKVAGGYTCILDKE